MTDTRPQLIHTPINLSLSLSLSLSQQFAAGVNWTEPSTQLKVRGQFWFDKTSQSENWEIVGMLTDFDHTRIFPRKDKCWKRIEKRRHFIVPALTKTCLQSWEKTMKGKEKTIKPTTYQTQKVYSLFIGMIVEEKLMNIILAIIEKSTKQKIDKIFTELLQPLNLKAAREYHSWATSRYYLQQDQENMRKRKRETKKKIKRERRKNKLSK